MMKNKKLKVDGKEITIISQQEQNYISLTDMAKSQLQDVIIIKWLSVKNTIEYLGEWETLYNPIFNYTEFGIIKNSAGSNNFVLSVKQWIERTNAIGITAKAGRYGNTFAHKDIAFFFGMWISPRFQLLLIKEFQRLKDEEATNNNLTWNLHRTISKINYRIHTDAIRDHLIPQEITSKQAALVYANEADLLNVALFGQTAKEWKESNSNEEGNIRDQANLEQLIVLSNMESINALLLAQDLSQQERLIQLNKVAISQMKSLIENNITKKLK